MILNPSPDNPESIDLKSRENQEKKEDETP